MIGIIGLLLSLVISLCWYLPCVRAPRGSKERMVPGHPASLPSSWLLGLQSDHRSLLRKSQRSTSQVFGGLLLLALIVFGAIYCVKTIRKVRRIAGNS